MVDSFLNPGTIALEHIGVPVEHIEVGHSFVDEGWQNRFGEFIIRAHVCITGRGTCVGEGHDSVDLELLTDESSRTD